MKKRGVFLDYKEIIQTEKGTLVTGLKCFSLGLILDCGQTFRWSESGGDWSGVAMGRELPLRQSADSLLFLNTDESEVRSVWINYFDLNRDYTSICERLSSDEHFRQACSTYPGIRLLKQDEWETLCSFIISQNNNIPRIKGIISRLCENFGERLEGGSFSFPSAQRLAALSPEELAPLRAGFRNKYIIDAAQKVASGEVDLNALKDAPAQEIRESLMKIKGVGAKVAECTLLFGFGYVDAFPVDVWVRRVVGELYPNGLPDCMSGVSGIAQQYLFHWRRNLGA